MNNDMTFKAAGDSVLVGAVLGGDRGAYASLVRRHQAAVCGTAYSVCGDFGVSEDIAQEAFVAAWRKLGELREPERFRAWTCGIARQLALGHVRKRKRRGDEAAGGAELADAVVAEGGNPQERAVSAEEQALLWRALERLPESYREPLVLFYREQQSVRAVAEALELSEDAVRQRLSRGRELLREEVSRMIERILGRTSPSMMFAVGVMGALPPLVGAAVTGTALGGAAVKAGGVGVGGIAPIAAGGLLTSLSSGLFWLYLGVRLWRSPALGAGQREVIRSLFLRVFILSTLLVSFLLWFGFTGGAGLRVAGFAPELAAAWAVVLFLCANLACAFLAARELGKAPLPEVSTTGDACGGFRQGGQAPLPQRRVSSMRLFGLPLWAIAFGADASRAERLGLARAWIALGDVAEGGLVAIGGVALAPIAVGGLALGAVGIGGASLGLLALGGMAAGGVACGGFAAGWWFAAGGAAFSNWAALGGLAFSGNWAVGGLSFGLHANDGVALGRLQSEPLALWFLRLAPYGGFLSLLGLPGAIVVLRKLRKLENR